MSTSPRPAGHDRGPEGNVTRDGSVHPMASHPMSEPLYVPWQDRQRPHPPRRPRHRPLHAVSGLVSGPRSTWPPTWTGLRLVLASAVGDRYRVKVSDDGHPYATHLACGGLAHLGHLRARDRGGHRRRVHHRGAAEGHDDSDVRTADSADLGAAVMTGQSNWFWVCPRCQTSNATGVCRSCGTPAPPPPIAPSVAPQRAKRQQTTAQKAAIGIGVVVVAVIGLVAWSVTGRHGPTQPAARQPVEEPAPPVARSLTDSQLKAAVTDNIRALYARTLTPSPTGQATPVEWSGQ